MVEPQNTTGITVYAAPAFGDQDRFKMGTVQKKKKGGQLLLHQTTPVLIQFVQMREWYFLLELRSECLKYNLSYLCFRNQLSKCRWRNNNLEVSAHLVEVSKFVLKSEMPSGPRRIFCVWSIPSLIKILLKIQFIICTASKKLLTGSFKTLGMHSNPRLAFHRKKTSSHSFSQSDYLAESVIGNWCRHNARYDRPLSTPEWLLLVALSPTNISLFGLPKTKKNVFTMTFEILHWRWFHCSFLVL